MKIEEIRESIIPIVKKVLPNKTPEAVIGIEKKAQGWKVMLEVLEQKVTPPTQDLVGIYEFSLDSQGNVLDYKRIKLKRRCDALEEDELSETKKGG